MNKSEFVERVLLGLDETIGVLEELGWSGNKIEEWKTHGGYDLVFGRVMRPPTEKEVLRREASKMRGKVLKRDNYRCVVCGSTDGMVVHHIVPLEISKDNSMDNLTTLCHEHHRQAHQELNRQAREGNDG
jgi:hypothetical protein